MGRVLAARRHGHGQNVRRVYWTGGLAPVFFKHGPVVRDWRPDSSAGVVGHTRWHPRDVFGLNVARQFEIHVADACDRRSDFDFEREREREKYRTKKPIYISPISRKTRATIQSQ